MLTGLVRSDVTFLPMNGWLQSCRSTFAPEPFPALTPRAKQLTRECPELYLPLVKYELSVLPGSRRFALDSPFAFPEYLFFGEQLTLKIDTWSA